MFILNLVTRDENLRESALNKLKEKFQTIVSYKLDEDVNEIVYCQNGDQNMDEWNKRMELSVQNVNKMMRTQAVNEQNIIEVQEFLQELKL